MEFNTKQLLALAFGLISFGIIIIVGMVLFTHLGNSVVSCTSGLTDVSVINETGWINSTGYTLSSSTNYGFTNLVITNAINKSSNLTIAIGNVTYTLAGVVYNNSAETWDNALLDYTFTWDDVHTWNTTTQTCLNATSEDAETGIGTAYTTTSYLNTSLGEGGLAGWIPAIIALAIGLMFLAVFLSKKGKQY